MVCSTDIFPAEEIMQKEREAISSTYWRHISNSQAGYRLELHFSQRFSHATENGLPHYFQVRKDAKAWGVEQLCQTRGLSPFPVTLPHRGQSSLSVPPLTRHIITVTMNHQPVFMTTRHTCKFCSKEGDIHVQGLQCRLLPDRQH